MSGETIERARVLGDGSTLVIRIPTAFKRRGRFTFSGALRPVAFLSTRSPVEQTMIRMSRPGNMKPTAAGGQHMAKNPSHREIQGENRGRGGRGGLRRGYGNASNAESALTAGPDTSSSGSSSSGSDSTGSGSSQSGSGKASADKS